MRRRTLLATGAALLASQARAETPILLGISGPLTGPNAQYGTQWKDGFDMALDDVGHAVGTRPLQYVFEDSQSDPRQAVQIAQKFVADRRIVMELGDFSSPASMAASAIYQRAGLVQFGFNNSHPDFTKAGSYMWSTSTSQADEQAQLADYTVNGLGFRRIALLNVNSDWGRSGRDSFAPAARALGAEIVAAEAFMPDERDFRPTLVRIRDTRPGAIVLTAYYSDAALIARQARDQGLTQTLIGVTSVYSPKLIELGGPAVEGFYTHSPFSPASSRPEVQAFVQRFQARYDREPGSFEAIAYDAMIMAHAALTKAGPETDRRAIRDAMEQVRDVPSLVFGQATFNPETRRVSNPRMSRMVVQNAKFVAWNGDRRAM